MSRIASRKERKGKDSDIVFLAKLPCSRSDFASGQTADGLGALKSEQFATTVTSLYHSIE
jgi:hypothetical protein